MESTNNPHTTAAEAINKSLEESANLFEVIRNAARKAMTDEATAMRLAPSIVALQGALIDAARELLDDHTAPSPQAAR